MKKTSFNFRSILLLSFTLIIQSGCVPTETPSPTHALNPRIDTPAPPAGREVAEVLTLLIEVSSSSDWMDLRIPDHQMVQYVELVEVSGDPTSYDVTEAGMGLNQSQEDAENRNIVTLSGWYQIGPADQVQFTLDKGCLGKTNVRISKFEGDGYSLLFDYNHEETETSSGCEQVQFFLDIAEMTVNLGVGEDEPVRSGYSLAEDSSYLKGARMFDEEEAFQHIAFLASDENQGRLIGTAGNLASGDYIAASFEESGLQPAGIDSTYFQPFRTTIINHIDQPALTVTSTDTVTYTTHYDYSTRMGRYMGSGEADGSVIWLGQCSPSDFSISMAGQIVLCGPQSVVDIHEAVSKALELKIGGLLIFSDDDGPYPRSGYGWGEMIDMPAFWISPAITADLLAGSGYDLEDLDQIAVPTTLAATVSMSCSYETVQVQGRNVLGLLPGTDPSLRDEYVIVGAHYDHVGTDPDGTIYNGANDNASGTAVVMEIARLWQEQGVQPARSVVFAAWDGEEVGLKGAGYYASDPIFPLENTVVYYNIDCVAVGDIFYIYGEGAAVDQLEISAATFGVAVNIESQPLGDDHEFVVVGVPSASIIVTLDDGDHYPELHRPEDDAEIIQLYLLRTTGIIFAHSLFISSMGN